MSLRSLLIATAAVAAGMVLLAGNALALLASPTTALNVRAGPSTSTAVLYTLRVGQVIDVESCGSGWCRLTSGGFASEAYLVPAGGAPAVVPPAPSPNYGGYSSANAGNPNYASNSGYGGGAPYPGPNTGYWGNSGPFGYHDDEPWYAREQPWPYPDDYDFDPPVTVTFGFRAGSAGPNSPTNFPFAFGIQSNNPVACFYEHPNYSAQAFCEHTAAAVSTMRRRWDDRISSIYVSPRYAVQVCTEPWFTGQCRVYWGQTGWVGAQMDNRISSYRIFRR